MAAAVSGGSRQVARAAFFAAYDRMLRGWPAGTEELDLTSDFGITRVQVSGPAGAPPLVLLHAHQASSAEWVSLVRLLNDDRRIYAIDAVGDAGYSVTGERSIANAADLVDYLDTVLDGLALTGVRLGGHSFGAWMALMYAINRPARVEELILLDPTMCVAPLAKGYVVRALPSLLRPTASRRLSLVEWETRGVAIEPEWLQVTGAAADAFSALPSVRTQIPKNELLAGLDVPVRMVIAGRSRVHDVQRLARRAGQFPRVDIETVAGASHYGLPLTHADQLAALILQGGS